MKKIITVLILIVLLFGVCLLISHNSLAAVNLNDVNPVKYPATTAGVQQLLGSIIKVILGVVGSIAFVMFIYGGMFMLTSRGNPEMISKGKNILIWSVIGLLVIFGSYVFVSFILTAIQGGGGGTSGGGTQTTDKSKICGNAESGTPTSEGWSCKDVSQVGESAFNQCRTGLCSGGTNIKCCQTLNLEGGGG